MQNRRYLWFVMMIVVGLIIGLLLGWNVFSRAPEKLGLNALRKDYKMDYVLMVAKFYQKEKDLAAAEKLLEKIETDPDQLAFLIQSTIDDLNARDTDDITKTVDIQSILILQQALNPGVTVSESEVAA